MTIYDRGAKQWQNFVINDIYGERGYECFKKIVWIDVANKLSS